MVFWDKFSGNDSFLKKQVITVGNSKYLRTLRKRGSWKQKLVIACNQFASVYLLWFRHIKWLLSLRGEGSLLLNLDLRALALAERSMKQLYDRTRHDCIYLSCFHVRRQRVPLPRLSACGWEAEAKPGALVRADLFCSWSLDRQRDSYLAITNRAQCLSLHKKVISATVCAQS